MSPTSIVSVCWIGAGNEPVVVGILVAEENGVDEAINNTAKQENSSHCNDIRRNFLEPVTFPLSIEGELKKMVARRHRG